MRYLIVFLSFIFVLLFVPTVHGQYITPVVSPQYSQLAINKTVRNPVSNVYVDNLSAQDYTFLPGQLATFRIEVKNVGQTELNNIQVKDMLPQLLDFEVGGGSYDKAARVLTFNVDNLKVGESRTFDFHARVQPTTGLVCVSNLAEARSGQLFGQDSTSVCIGGQILGGVQELPVTGVGSATLIIAGSGAALFLSLMLLRRSFINKV